MQNCYIYNYLSIIYLKVYFMVKEEYKKKLIKLILKYLPNAKIYLFGSRALNKEKKDSDIDIAIDVGKKAPQEKVSLIRLSINDLNIPFEVDLVDIYNLPEKFKKLIKKFDTFQQALIFLGDAIEMYDSESKEKYMPHLRNSKIQSFEFCVDLLWKFLKTYFYEVSGKKLENSPKPIFRHCLSANITNEQETVQLLKMIDDRNLSSHTYHEGLAIEISNRIEKHYALLLKIAERLENLIEKLQNKKVINK
ncbi:hypothetical protein GF385_01545 [Candidatus Dependentiae bacterium]|nr:hypothetical protein [Candidatus Dependentiae bacterium]